MRRREFIAGLGSAVAWPFAVGAQQGERLRRIGLLSGLSGAAFEESIRQYWRELQALGWTERSLRIEARPTNTNDPEVIRPYAEALVRLMPDVIIVTNGTPTAVMLGKLTNTIPIIYTGSGDPVLAGSVQSFAHPGGNITGFITFEASINGKYVQLLKDIAPQVTRVAVLQTQTSSWRDDFSVVQEAAPKFAMTTPVAMIVPDEAAEIERKISSFAGEAHGGLVLPPDVITVKHHQIIVDLAARYRLPAVYGARVFAEAGGLLSYAVKPMGPRLIVGYVDRILRGAKVSDLPVQAATAFELVINMKTAKALGLTIPETLLLRADEVIE
jgi:putative ABC transport system substrate-binding protein